MGTIEYWWKVGIPLWWKEKRQVLLMLAGLALAVFWLIPRGFLWYKMPCIFKGRNCDGTKT